MLEVDEASGWQITLTWSKMNDGSLCYVVLLAVFTYSFI